SSRRRHTRSDRDWSSDVCSSDLALRALLDLLEQWIGPKGHRFLPLIATFGVFILLGNYMGLIPGLMAPTSSINVTLGCALTTWRSEERRVGKEGRSEGVREHDRN